MNPSIMVMYLQNMLAEEKNKGQYHCLNRDLVINTGLGIPFVIGLA